MNRDGVRAQGNEVNTGNYKSVLGTNQQHNIAAQLGDERRYRGSLMGWAAVDLHLAATSIPAVAELDTMQTEAQQNPWELKIPGGHDLITTIATTDLVDWKAAGVAASAWAAISVTRRMQPHFRFRREAEAAVEQIKNSSGFVPETRGQTRLRRLGRRAATGAMATTAAAVGYKLGEANSLEVDAVASASLIGVTYAKIQIEEIRDKLFTRRHRKLMQQKRADHEFQPSMVED